MYDSLNIKGSKKKKKPCRMLTLYNNSKKTNILITV